MAQKNYHLSSLAEMVLSACNVGNFCQVVKEPTRFQFDSVNNRVQISCIDHVYTNHEFRCSKVDIIPFGNSDHNAVCYVRYAKDPVLPVRTIKRRSYENFNLNDFLADLSKVD